MIVANPVGQGGLSKTKLALANATVVDVLAGKKFYSQDKTLKTGTLSLAATATPADVAKGKTFFAGSKTLKTGTSDAEYRFYSGYEGGLGASFSVTFELPFTPEYGLIYHYQTGGTRGYCVYFDNNVSWSFYICGSSAAYFKYSSYGYSINNNGYVWMNRTENTVQMNGSVCEGLKGGVSIKVWGK